MLSVQEWLNNLADSDSSTEKDSTMLQNMLRRVGYSNAKVTYGIVYLSGYGNPESIHKVAKELVNICEGKQ